MSPLMDRIRPVTTFIDFGRLTRRPFRPLWLRVGLGLMLMVGAFSLVGLPRALGEGSANLEANGGKRALTEWRTSLYGNLLPRRTLFKVYAKVGEEIALGSSGVGVGSGDIVVWTPGHITSPLTVALPTPDFTCSSSQRGLGAMTTRAQEVAGPTPATGGYTPCTYTAATTGVYDVAFYGPAGGQSDADGNAGTIAAPVIDTSQASGVSMWDITVRSIANPSAPISGRVFTDYLAQITGGNGAGYRVQSTLWAVTNDGFEYRIDLRGLDPNGFILYGNTVGFLNPDGVTPLYHDLVADINPLTAIEGGVTLSPPTGLLFFVPPAADLPSSIVPTPVVPTVNSITFQGTAGVVGGVPGSVYGTGGNIVFDGNIGGVAHVVIVPNPGGSGGCASAVFDSSLPTNRSLVRVVAAGVQNLAWDGKDNSGAYMPESWTGNGGSGYCFSATLHAGEYHFPLLDAENSVLGGPTITLLNPPGGACPFASCSTAFFDDRGYQTSNGATVGTVGSVLPGNNPPPPPDFSDSGFDTTSTTIRAFGDNSSNGFGNQKGLDLWTYFPSKDVVGQLYVVPQGASDLSITKTHVGDFTVGVDGVYALTVRNVGSGSLAGLITVSDPVPSGLNVVSAAGTGWACGVSGQAVTCTVTPAGGLASGASLPDISVTVNPTLAAVPSVTNAATVANDNDLNPGNDSSSSPTRIQVVADLAITKDDGTTSVGAGGSTTYTLTVTNNGPSTVSGAILADPAVTGLAKTGVACSGTPGQCTSGTTPTGAQLEGGTFALPALASGQTYGLSVTADVTATSGSVANTATVSPPTGATDPDGTNDSATDTDTVSPAPVVADLAITKDDGTTSVGAGGSTTYTLTVTNNGPSTVSGAILADPAVTGLAKTGVACSGTPGQCTSGTTPTGAQLEGGTFALPALASGQTYGLSVTADVTATSGSVANTATVSAPTGATDPDGTNDSATDTDTVTPAPVVADLAITKTDGTTAVGAGGSTTYTLTVTNNGPSTVSGAILADPAVTGLAKTGVACSGTPGQCTSGTTPTVAQLEGGTFALPALAAGQTYGLSVTADVTATSGSVANTATVSAPTGATDPDGTNDSATDTDTVSPAPVVADLAITKTDGTTAVGAGGSTTYTLTVTNNGPSTVSGAILADPAVTGLAKTGVACSGTPGQCTSGTTPTGAQLEGGTFALPALASGQTYGLSVTADVTATSGSVANTATVSPPTGATDPDGTNDSATDTDTVSPAIPTPTPTATRTPTPTPARTAGANGSSRPVPPTDTLTTVDSGVSGTSWLVVFGIFAGLLAAISLLAPGRMRRRD